MMKNTHIYMLILFVFLLACTGNTDTNLQYQKANDFLFSHPDSTLQIINNDLGNKKLSRLENARVILLKTHALYRTNQLEKADSTFLKSLDYFRKNNYKKEEGISYYLLGSFSNLESKTDSAIFYFKSAEICLRNENEPIIQGLIYYNLGDLYLTKELYENALTHFKKAENYFQQTNDIFHLAYNYSRIANTLNLLGKEQNTILFAIDKAIDFSKQTNDSNFMYYNLQKKGEYLIGSNIKAAKAIFIHLYKNNQANDRSKLFLADIYIKEQKPDSAKIYMNLINDRFNNKTDHLNYIIILSKLYKYDKNYSRALDSVEDAYLLRDSIYIEKSNFEIRKIDRKLDILQLENQNLQLKIHKRDLIIYLATASLIIIVFFILLVLKLKQNRLAKANAEIIQQLQKKELESLNLANKQKKMLLKFKLMNHIQTTVKLKELEYSMNKKQNLEKFRNDVLENFQIKDKEWDTYIEEVDQIYDNKIEKLKQDYPKLTKNDIILIILIWHHIDIDDSCRILNLGKDTIYKRRNKMKEKLGINEDIHIDNWLISLITD